MTLGRSRNLPILHDLRRGRKGTGWLRNCGETRETRERPWGLFWTGKLGRVACLGAFPQWQAAPPDVMLEEPVANDAIEYI